MSSCVVCDMNGEKILLRLLQIEVFVMYKTIFNFASTLRFSELTLFDSHARNGFAELFLEKNLLEGVGVIAIN